MAYGDPVPLVARWFGANKPHVTPALATTCSEELLAGTAFRLYDRPAGKPVHVELDYRRRVALEQVAWPRSTPDGDAPEPWCPLVLTSLHPHGSFDDIQWTAEGGRFFWVRPKDSDITSLLANLAAATRDEIPAGIAVLPELALHHSDALGPALSAAPDLYPPLVVAGSAHEEDDDRRLNRSRTYLEGVELLEQVKYSSAAVVSSCRNGVPELADIPLHRLPSGARRSSLRSIYRELVLHRRRLPQRTVCGG